jgi:hypothetical protein
LTSATAETLEDAVELALMRYDARWLSETPLEYVPQCCGAPGAESQVTFGLTPRRDEDCVKSMNHKRRRPKHQRAGCLLCKPHKDEREAKRPRSKRLLMELYDGRQKPGRMELSHDERRFW